MRRAPLVFLIYCGLTLALTHPLLLHLNSAMPNDAGDPALNTWILWWNAQAVPYTATWWNAPAFYPVAGVLAFSENLAGLSLVSTPLQWLGVGPQAAYNVVFLLTFPLSALGAYLLARELIGRDDAAFVAGLLFGFAPFRIAHLPQIQCLAAFPMPFALLGLHRYLRDPRPRWLALFGAGWLLQALCNGYYMLFFAVVVGCWMLWFAPPWSSPKTFASMLAAWVAASLPLAPLLWQYREIHAGFGFERNFGTIRDFGADVAALLDPAHTLAFWKWLRVYHRPEGELFPGLTLALLIAAGAAMTLLKRREALASDRPRGPYVAAVRRGLALIATVAAFLALRAVIVGPWRLSVFGVQVLSVTNPTKPLTFAFGLGIGLALTSPGLRRLYAGRSIAGFYGLAAFLTWLLSLGPSPTLMGNPLMYRGPYALLMLLPGFNALRVPARFWMMTTLCLAVIGAMMFDRLANRFHVSGGIKRLVAAVVVACGVVADGWVADFPLAAAPAPWRVESCGEAPQGSGAFMELPLGAPDRDVAAMYRAMEHGRPVVNGYSGFFPPHYAALRFGLSLRDGDVLTQLAAHGVTDVVVDESVEGGGDWASYVASHPGVRTICSEDRRTRYRLGPPNAGMGEIAGGAPLAVAVLSASVNDGDVRYMLDGDRTTRWQSGPQSDRTVVNIDLGAERQASAIQLLLGPYVEDFPRALSIEVLESGAVWREIYRGGAAGRAFVGAFQAPQDVPLAFTFPRTTARYFRLRLLSNDETYYWSIAELKVLG